MGKQQDPSAPCTGFADAYTYAQPGSFPRGNAILDSLPAREARRLAPSLKEVTLAAGDILVARGRPVSRVLFPLEGFVAEFADDGLGSGLDMAFVGREGAVGALGVVSGWEAPVAAVCRIGGRALAIEAAECRIAIDRGGLFGERLRSYGAIAAADVVQSALCGRHHGVAERLARWLLEAHDRSAHDVVPITHTHLSRALGVHRPATTLAAGTLQAAGVIRTRRGRTEIIDRDGLERMACGCYSTIRPIRRQYEVDLAAPAGARRAGRRGARREAAGALTTAPDAERASGRGA